jgi:cold shock CspA family protein
MWTKPERSSATQSTRPSGPRSERSSSLSGEGFGFITPDDQNKQAVFIAGKIVTRAGLEILYTGDRVEYIRIADRYGRADCANRIKLLREEAAE